MNCPDKPIWEKYTPTTEEKAKYFRVRENTPHRMAEESLSAIRLILHDNRMRVKRKQTGRYMDSSQAS